MSENSKGRRVCLIGWPIAKSPSPAMHNAAFAEMGIDWSYEILPVEPGDESRFHDTVTGLGALGFAGANVTIPFKQAVIPYLERVSRTATAIGAVNTIAVSETGKMSGDNTDATGFVADLDDKGVDPNGADVLIIGAGGSARAVIWAVAGASARSVSIMSRTTSRARRLAEEMAKLFSTTTFEVMPFTDPIDTAEYDMIVSCVPIEAYSSFESTALIGKMRFRPRQVVYDLVYRPKVTPLLRLAMRSGAVAHNGLGMLVRQGTLSFEMWTGVKAPIKTMRLAAEEFVRRTA